MKDTDITNNEHNFTVLSCNKNLKLKKSKVIKTFDNGIKPIYEVTTQLGRKIKVTLNHPFLTVNGWKALQDLKVENRIAVPRSLPILNRKPYPVKDYHLTVLGYLLAEGNLCHPHGFYFYSNYHKGDGFVEWWFSKAFLHCSLRSLR